MEKRTSAKKQTTRRKASGKRELINTGTDKRFVRRNSKGQIKESDDVGRSLAVDRRRTSKTKAKAGQGDKGDRKITAKARTAAKAKTTTKAKSKRKTRTKTKTKARAK